MAYEVLQKYPPESVFIDDRENNVREAAGIGLHAIQYKGSAALRAELEQLELL
jgi:FMN phosphatase YigB (HAD superfamily)